MVSDSAGRLRGSEQLTSGSRYYFTACSRARFLCLRHRHKGLTGIHPGAVGPRLATVHNRTVDIPAELAYLFRQPLMRDAAYQLQMPSDRARLHRFAFEILEAMFDGPPPEPQPDEWGDLKCEPHTTDPVSGDLAEHASRIREWAGDDDGTLIERERLYLRRAAEYAETQFDIDDAVRLWHRLPAMVESTDRAIATESLHRAGLLLVKSGRPLEAKDLIKNARTMATDAGNRRAEGIALGNLATIYQMTGQVKKSERASEQALIIHREVGNRRFEGMALGQLAIVQSNTGRVKQAERTYEQALTLHREVGNRHSEGIVLGNFALLYMQTGRMDEARRTCEQALIIHREVGNRRFEGMALGYIANVYEKTGRLEKAERNYELALTIHREVGNRRHEGIALSNFAVLNQKSGRLEQAERHYEKALTIHLEVGNRRQLGITLGNLAVLYGKTGRMKQAERNYKDALTIHREVGNRRFEGVELGNLANLYSDTGARGASRTHL